VARLKILDPACGSGSFLLGAYQALIDWHVRYYGDKERLTKRDRAVAYLDSDGRVRLTARLKRQILLNNLFGVDIDPQAVEVTRLSLSLKALEDTRHDELYDERTLFKQTVLPDLSGNVKCGNSLIGPDYFAGRMFPNADELRRVNPFDWEQAFPQAFLPSPAGRGRGGFDAVIGNPPYLRIQGLQEFYGNQVEYLAAHCKSAVKRFDLYLLFIEKGFQLLKDGGRLGFICPHKFLNSDFGSGLRGFLISNSALEAFISFGNNLIFNQVTTYTGLLFLRKVSSQLFRYFEFIGPSLSDVSQKLLALSPCDFTEYHLQDFNADPWILAVRQAPALLQTLSKQELTLADVCDQILVGVQSGIDNVHIMKFMRQTSRGNLVLMSERAGIEVEIEEGLVKPLLMGEDVHRYSEAKVSHYCIYPYQLVDGKTRILEETDLRREFPRGYAYLKEYRKELTEIRTRQKTNPKYWYSCHRSRDMRVFESQRIITPEISLGCNMTIAPAGVYHNTKVYSIVPKPRPEHQNYWLGVLNSRVLWWFLSNTGYVLRGGYFVFKTNYLQPFPIPAINFSDPAAAARHDRMVQLVTAMLALHKHKAAARTQAEQVLYQHQIEATDRQIDALVYELYGLTAEEIAVVEGRE
jgi:adenine-specific DNA-methyltransferase